MTKTPGDVVADRVRSYRRMRGLSVRQLADECRHAGAVSLTAASLANIERGRSEGAKRGRREVTVDELLALAYVLTVPPTLLLIPLGTDDEVAVVPGVSVHPHAALEWFEGEAWRVPGDLVRSRADWQSAALPLSLYRRLRELSRRLERADADLNNRPALMEYVGDNAEQQQLLQAERAEFASALADYAGHLGLMIDHGVRPPTTASYYAEQMRALGIGVPEGIRLAEDPSGEEA